MEFTTEQQLHLTNSLSTVLQPMLKMSSSLLNA